MTRDSPSLLILQEYWELDMRWSAGGFVHTNQNSTHGRIIIYSLRLKSLWLCHLFHFLFITVQVVGYFSSRWEVENWISTSNQSLYLFLIRFCFLIDLRWLLSKLFRYSVCSVPNSLTARWNTALPGIWLFHVNFAFSAFSNQEHSHFMSPCLS